MNVKGGMALRNGIWNGMRNDMRNDCGMAKRIKFRDIFFVLQLLQKCEPEGRVMIVALRAPSLAKFGEVDTIPVSENSLTIIYEEITSTAL